ncbi:DUF1775 domain-containing protein [Kitasatospora sp. NPDC097605]|uniref:DUF1775 domain-containing protein n=1 Tax=Kitasatospora sp. NPDC097605 TaxID=3157226 RepID=UPI0033218891
MSVSRSRAVARAVARAATVAASAAAALALTAAPALAHVEVESDDARALAANVTVTFTGEAESDTAGLAKVQVVLPEGIAPGDVALAGAPAGWTFAATADGYTVGGPALAVGQDAVHRITVRRLPDTDRLVFRTLETYGDGHVDRWIEPPGDDGVEPAHPAPVLRLAPAAAGTTSLPPTTAAPSLPPAAAGEGGGSSPAVPVALAVGAAFVLAAALGVRRWRRAHGRGPAG